MRRLLTPGALSWIGLFAAPFAWATQHVAGVWATQVRCGDLYQPHPSFAMRTVVIAITAGALLIALTGEAAAITAWRRTREAGEDPPDSRIHFVGVMGMTFSPLFAAIILAGGLGALLLPECVQS